MSAQPHPFLPALFPVKVSFTPTPKPTFTFEGLDPNNNLLVKTGMATIVLQLVPAEGQALTFNESPVTWFGEASPACMTVQRNSDTQVTIVNYNTNMEPGEPEPYDFEISIWCDGIGYMSQDPTILNAQIPPTPLPGCDDGDRDRDDCRDEGQRVKRGQALRAV